MISNAQEKYEARARALNTMLCVGLDPDFSKIPDRFENDEYPQLAFNKWVIDETHEYALAYKPNTAFYEARGARGIEELRMTMEYVQTQHPDILTILDAKRGDIGNTNLGYCAFAFDYLKADAITLHPYLGKEALQPFLDREDKLSIILCRTSNSGSEEFQDIKSEGKPLWEKVAENVAQKWNQKNNCMLVVGATYPQEMKRIREITGDMTFLVPGVGAQGGSVAGVLTNGLNSKAAGLIINSSRGIIFAESPKEEARKLVEEIGNYIKS